MGILNVQLLIIDPQNDFIDQPGAKLAVPGAAEDMKRVARMIQRIGKKLDDIHITLDSHGVIDIAHPGFWRDQNGNMPKPLTIISHDDVVNGIWAPRDPRYLRHALMYTKTLEQAGKYMLIVWPEHCLIGSWGHNVYEPLLDVLQDWERREFASVSYITKGTNVGTEHYGALMAEVPDVNDPSTQLNMDVIRMLQKADRIGIAGEASSHCVLATVQQIVDNIGEEHLPKLHLMTDGMSPVPRSPGTPDFPVVAQDFLHKMEARGLVLTTTTQFLA